MESEPRQSVPKFAARAPAPATEMCGGKREDLGRLGVSKDVIEKEGSYAFLRQSVVKRNPLKYKLLLGYWGAQEGEKKGDPKNEGKSKDVYENKGQEKTARESL
jgi:hypothetical protein